jgi:hypothetical protein
MSLQSIYQTRGDITNPNLKSVMAKLATYNPDQLKAFAEHHQDDMILLGAAQAVHANHEKFAQAKMAQQGGQMPPVNQQVVQNIGPVPRMPQGMPPQGMPPQGGQGMPPQASGQLPEQQGIAQLPTPNIQNMAGGGIVAFADGGYTDEDVLDSNTPVAFMADGGYVPRYQGVPTAMGGDGSVVSSNPMFNIPGMNAPQPRASFTQQGAPENTPFFSRIGQGIADENKKRQLQRIEQRIAEGTATAEEKDFYQTEKIKAGDAAATEAKYPAKDAVLAKDFPGVTTNLAKIDAAVPNTGTPKAAAAPGPRPAAGPAASGIATIKPEDYRAQMEGFMPKEIIDPFAPERIDIAAAEKNVKQKQLTEFEKDIADRGLAGKGQEERIGKRETELGKQKDMNTNMSIIEAGLAMMQSKGRGLAGIAEGAAVGTRAYASGIERLRTAQEKIDDARDNLETLRRNEDTMTSKERRAIKNDIENTTVSAKKDALAGLQQVYNIDRQDAREFFKTAEASREKALDRQTQKQIAAMPSAQMQVLSALGGGNVETGLRLMTEIQAGKRTLEQSYEDYLKAFAGKDTTLTPPLTAMQYVTQIKQLRAAMDPNKVPGAIDGTADRK